MRLAVLLICVLIAAGVFAAMFVAIWRSKRAAAPTPALHQGFAVELIWAMIPCLIIVAAAAPAVIAVANQK
jgi:cytochrome c oxidase subunit II